MRLRSVRGLVRTLLVPAAAALTGAGFGAAATQAHAGASAPAESPYDVVQKLARVLVEVEQFYVDPVPRAKLLRGAVKGMVGELDPHSAYLPADEWAEFKSETQGRFAGVGIEVDLRGDAVTVIAPIEGSPADRAGIKTGDRIIAIDGEPILEVSVEKTVKRMRGAAGTKVRLTIRRQGAPQSLQFDLVRQVVRLASVRSKLLVGNVAYLRLRQFQEGSHAEIVRVAQRLREASADRLRGVVLDLRNNPGGLVDEAVGVADELLDGGGIYTSRHRGVVVDDVRARRGGSLANVPLVVLVNEGSASASELLAGALQDNARALVVGSQTFGKGSVQAILELPDSAGMKLTIARYYTPSGRAVQAAGIEPDVLIAAAVNEPDPRLREESYPNHLPREPGAPRRASTDGGVAPVDGGLEPTDVRDLPADPRGGPDYGLEVALDVLEKQIIPRGARVR